MVRHHLLGEVAYLLALRFLQCKLTGIDIDLVCRNDNPYDLRVRWGGSVRFPIRDHRESRNACEAAQPSSDLSTVEVHLYLLRSSFLNDRARKPKEVTN